MPTSSIEQVSAILRLVSLLRPTSVLDIGVGLGRYGFLCRELLDHQALSDVYPPATARSTRIDGIEAFEAYLLFGQRPFYDDILLGDARAILPQIADGRYDLALLIDVLEHFPLAEGAALLRQMRRVARWSIVATPMVFSDQQAEYGNQFERHRSLWSAPLLRQHGAHVLVPTPGQHVALLCAPSVAEQHRATLRAWQREAQVAALKQPLRLLPDWLQVRLWQSSRVAARMLRTTRHP